MAVIKMKKVKQSMLISKREISGLPESVWLKFGQICNFPCVAEYIEPDNSELAEDAILAREQK